MKSVNDVLTSFESNIYCLNTFSKGLKDYEILRRVLKDDEAHAIGYLIVEMDMNNPDTSSDGKAQACKYLSKIIKYLKKEYSNKFVSTENVPKDYEQYWSKIKSNSYTYCDALSFATNCENIVGATL